jgi:NTE family protein
LENGNMVENIFASATLPGFFPSMKKDDYLLVDGGVCANLPVIEAKGLHSNNKIIAIDLNSNTTLQPNKPFSILAAIDIMKEEMINEVERSKADYIIDIDVSRIKLGDFTRYREAIREGYRQTKKHIDKIREMLK